MVNDACLGHVDIAQISVSENVVLPIVDRTGIRANRQAELLPLFGSPTGLCWDLVTPRTFYSCTISVPRAVRSVLGSISQRHPLWQGPQAIAQHRSP